MQELYELLFWFELELTGPEIAKMVNANYRKAHGCYDKVRGRLLALFKRTLTEATRRNLENFLNYLKEKEFRFNHRHLIDDDFVDKMLEVLLNRAEFTP